jgi:hypothetical protein
VAAGRHLAPWGVVTPQVAARVQPSPALLDLRGRGGADVCPGAKALKIGAASYLRLTNSPITRRANARRSPGGGRMGQVGGAVAPGAAVTWKAPEAQIEVQRHFHGRTSRRDNSTSIFIALALASVSVSGCGEPGPRAAGGSSDGQMPHADATETKALNQDLARLATQMHACESAVDDAANVAKRGNSYAAYGPVSDAKATCERTQAEIDGFDFSHTISKERRGILEDIKAECSMAAMVQGLHMQMVAEVVNGDTSPAKVEAAHHGADTVVSYNATCASKIFSAAEKAGFPREEISFGKRAAEPSR